MVSHKNSLRVQYLELERDTGVEPATCSLATNRSATELVPQILVRRVGLEPTIVVL